jgi:glycosyltransferase involved in cell wall biosynthesis
MSQQPFHWFILGGGLSPYTLALWECVAGRSNHVVTLAHVPRERQADFAHEGKFIHSPKVELVPVQSLKTVIDLAFRCSSEPRAAIVCMGYSPIYNLLISAIGRATTRNKRMVLYMSDTNGIALAQRAGASWLGGAAFIAKRIALSSTFATSLDLGFSNTLAHQLQGIGKGIDIPLLPIEFPASMEAEVPEPLATLVRELPRPRLLTVARLVECKNLVGMVEAFADAARKGMPGSLTIVGDGPKRSILESLIRQIPGRAILAGAVPFNSSRRLFGAFDGMVLPSTFEPWGIAIVEGLGWGIPVLSSRQCGAGVSLAFEFGDAVKLCGTSREEIHSSLLNFVSNLDRHTITAKAAAPLVRRRFGIVEVADALIELAGGICESGRVSRIVP